MATIHKFEQKKQADRRTALLGLAADQPAEAGVCPTSAEMAELVDQCSTEKKEQFFRHIAICENCYREWLTLQMVLDKRIGSKKKSRVFKFFEPGKMALFGTLLAAAASVVVFLNINLPTTEKTSLIAPIESVRQEPSSVREEEKSRPAVPAEQQDTPPAPAKSASKPEPLRKKQETPASVDAFKMEKKRSVPAAPATMHPAPASALKKDLPAQESISAEQALPKAAGEAAATDGAVRSQTGGGIPALRHNRLQAGAAVFGQWREQLENGCREQRTSEAFWQEMERKGREVKARSGELQQDEQTTLENLLLQTSGMETANIQERCRKILDLLAEERKGRADSLH
jgi:hypothetical protein